VKRLLVALFVCLIPFLFEASLPSLSVFSNAEEAGEAAAEKLLRLIQEKQKEKKSPVVLGLATGSSPVPFYNAFKRLVAKRQIDLSDVVTFNLDEYMGLPRSHPHSYYSEMFRNLFAPLLYSEINQQGIRIGNIHIPNGSALLESDLDAKELRDLENAFPGRQQGIPLPFEEQLWISGKRSEEYEETIRRLGPIDLLVLGIGANGHIAFQEPGASFDSKTGVVALSEQTRKDNARFFKSVEEVPTHAISMGIGTILQADEILLIATGAHKATAIRRALHDPVSPDFPATALRLHKNVSFFLDEPASRSLIKRFTRARLLRGRQIEEGELWILEGKIIPPQNEADLTLDLKGALVAPGFIDLQINGAFGCDFSRNPERIEEAARRLTQYGVTAFLPTLVSTTPERYRALLPLLQPRTLPRTAAILGIHLEGPFLSHQYCGAHRKGALRGSLENTSLEEFYGSLEGVKLVTLAPELPGALETIKKLRQAKIRVAAGHSNASFLEMRKGIESGISLSTHLFNAMHPFHHRDAGLIGAALTDPNHAYTLIVDNVHLSPETTLLCWKCNPEGLILISDAIEALGVGDGIYSLGTETIHVRQNVALVGDTGRIAGSVLSLDQAVRNFRAITHCSIPEALEAASLKPAKLLGLYPLKGSLEVGADADFVVLTDQLMVRATYIAGELAWGRPD